MAEPVKKLRSGYTTGACAAAAAKAATMRLLGAAAPAAVEIPFPDGRRISFPVKASGRRPNDAGAYASVIKDAGDDPDITNGAEIVADVTMHDDGCAAPDRRDQAWLVIQGGPGVGTVTKRGLAVPVGEPAINPVPRTMISAAVREALTEFLDRNRQSLIGNRRWEVTISVPAGEELAKKTLNARLGIIGGISILGTTGIVKPLSEAAWTATITASFDVAQALGLDEVVISTGRTSEKAHQRAHGLPEEAYAMMGDYTEFSLLDAKRHGFRKVHVCAQWAKMIKIAMGTPQTHVRHGALEADAARDFLISLGIGLPPGASYTTAREIYEFIRTDHPDSRPALTALCKAARTRCEAVAGGVQVTTHLVSYEGEIVADSE